MDKEIKYLNTFRIVGLIALVVFCFAIGEMTAILLAGLIYDVNYIQVFEMIKEIY